MISVYYKQFLLTVLSWFCILFFIDTFSSTSLKELAAIACIKHTIAPLSKAFFIQETESFLQKQEKRKQKGKKVKSLQKFQNNIKRSQENNQINALMRQNYFRVCLSLEKALANAPCEIIKYAQLLYLKKYILQVDNPCLFRKTTSENPDLLLNWLHAAARDRLITIQGTERASACTVKIPWDDNRRVKIDIFSYSNISYIQRKFKKIDLDSIGLNYKFIGKQGLIEIIQKNHFKWPTSISSLTYLTTFRFSYGYWSTILFEELPKEFMHLIHLEKLEFTRNTLKKIDGKIFERLTNLQELDFSENEITEFPPEFACLHKLQKLNVWGNKFSQLPVCLMNMSALKSALFAHNYLKPKAQKKLKRILHKKMQFNCSDSLWKTQQKKFMG